MQAEVQQDVLRELNKQLDGAHVIQQEVIEKNQELENEIVMLRHQCDTLKEIVFQLNNQLEIKDTRIATLQGKIQQLEKICIITPDSNKKGSGLSLVDCPPPG